MFSSSFRLQGVCSKLILLCGVLCFLHMLSVSCQCSNSRKNALETLTISETPLAFSTPGYRVAYYSRMNCRWIVDAGSDSATIVFDIQEILIESYRNCVYDALIIYSGNTTSDPVVKTLCGRLYSGDTITVSGRYALMRMKSDASRQYAGVKMRIFYAEDQSGNACSGSSKALTATTSTQFLTSPGYPVSMASGLSCSWTITGSVGTVLRLEVVFSDMESGGGFCTTQVLALYDGTSTFDSALQSQYCDSREIFPTTQSVYYTTGNTAHVTLTTSAAMPSTRLGFRLNYLQNSSAVTTTQPVPTTTTVLVQVCSASPTLLNTDDTEKFFQSVNYPLEYYNNINCYWLIAAPTDYMINLTFVDSLLQESLDCRSADSVTVYDGSTSSHRMMEAFCGETSPNLVSTGRNMYIHLSTDATIFYRGFSAKYTQIQAEVPACVVPSILGNYTATDTSQTITSPGYPDLYNQSMSLYWLIHNPNETQGLTINVEDSRIEGSVGCRYDNVKVYQGPCTSYPVLKTFCGLEQPDIYYNTGSYALIVLTTDDTAEYKGFTLNFYLSDNPAEDGISSLVITGIVVGGVIGALVVTSAVAFGVYKFLQHGKPKGGSPNPSRRSSSSSSSSSTSSSSSSSEEGRPRAGTSGQHTTEPIYKISKVPAKLPPLKGPLVNIKTLYG